MRYGYIRKNGPETQYFNKKKHTSVSLHFDVTEYKSDMVTCNIKIQMLYVRPQLFF